MFCCVRVVRWHSSWDNTGLLLEASFVPSRRQSNTALLTIDLTKAVADEAIALNSSIIIAYHPIIFRGLKALTLADSQQQSLLRLASHGISVYSPHTALDSAPGGINDWLADIVTGTKSSDDFSDTDTQSASQLSKQESNVLHHQPSQQTLQGQFRKLASASAPYSSALKASVQHDREPIKRKTPEIASHPGAGMGRIVRFHQPQPLPTLLDRIGKGLNNPKGFPIAIPQDKNIEDIEIRSVGICAGSGASMLNSLDVDLLFTGEMAHHEALSAIEQGRVVISLFHSNSERGFLADVLRGQLEETVQEEWAKLQEEERDNNMLAEALAEDDFDIEVSEVDRDPYGIVVLNPEAEDA
jgi:dinuclear metal center YbgI/SA1388 family protein